jgi:hypothetical protein
VSPYCSQTGPTEFSFSRENLTPCGTGGRKLIRIPGITLVLSNVAVELAHRPRAEAAGLPRETRPPHDEQPIQDAIPEYGVQIGVGEYDLDHLMILVRVPAPTVRPPSRMVNRMPSSITIGWISATVILVSSPGMTISVPSGRVTTPVTSVVRK